MSDKATLEPRWKDYFQVTQSRPPHATLIKALAAFDRESILEPERLGYDLGCGAGRDAMQMLQKGWRVIAVDRDQGGLDMLATQAANFSSPLTKKLELHLEDLSALSIPPASALLINASFSLPFCSPESFDGLWREITLGIRPSGRFSGHFFGLNDTWASRQSMTFKSQSAVSAMFREFNLEIFEEEEEDKPTALGDPKHWHVFSVVAQKKK